MAFDPNMILTAVNAAGSIVEKGFEFAKDRSNRKEKMAEERRNAEVSRQIQKNESTMKNIQSAFHTALDVSAEVRNVFVEISKGKQWDKEFELKVEEIKRQHDRNMKELEIECKKIDKEFDEKEKETQNNHDKNMLTIKGHYSALNKKIDNLNNHINRLLDLLMEMCQKDPSNETISPMLSTLSQALISLSSIVV